METNPLALFPAFQFLSYVDVAGILSIGVFCWKSIKDSYEMEIKCISIADNNYFKWTERFVNIGATLTPLFGIGWNPSFILLMEIKRGPRIGQLIAELCV
jgi:hypothetical protein